MFSLHIQDGQPVALKTRFLITISSYVNREATALQQGQ